jgi:DNA repair exonuclease SbcCD ATPase subunit
MRKQLNKLKNEFDNLSSLLKEVTEILSTKESEINKSIACRDDLILFKEKLAERKDKQDRLLELTDEGIEIDKNIESSKKEYYDFQGSKEFLNTINTLEKINDRKKELQKFEKNLINMIANLSRPITKFSYLASKETQGRLALLQNQPLEIFSDKTQYIQLFGELRKQIVDKSIQIKDPEKTIHQIDEIINSIPSLSSELKKLKEELSRLESSISSINMRRLEDMKSKTEMYEKYRSENVSKMGETKNSIFELDSSIDLMKKKIEENVLELTNTNYSIFRD